MEISNELRLDWTQFSTAADWDSELPKDILAFSEILARNEDLVQECSIPSLMSQVQMKSHLGKRLIALSYWAAEKMTAEEVGNYFERTAQ